MNYLTGLLLVIGSCVGCGHLGPTLVRDAALEPYIARFEALYGHPVNSRLSYYFEELDDNIIGTCTIRPTKRLIKIDPSYWALVEDDLEREQLMFHELGHCVLNRGHDETLTDLGPYHDVPTSLMYPVAFAYYDYYSGFHDHYMRELFDQSDNEFKNALGIENKPRFPKANGSDVIIESEDTHD